MKISNCCGAEIVENADLCASCLEHCGVEEVNEEEQGMDAEERIIIGIDTAKEQSYSLKAEEKLI